MEKELIVGEKYRLCIEAFGKLQNCEGELLKKTKSIFGNRYFFDVPVRNESLDGKITNSRQVFKVKRSEVLS